MRYSDVKRKLINLFEPSKLEGKLNDEWGFLSEFDKDIQTIGYATNLSVNVVDEAARNNVDLLLTHHNVWDFMYDLKEKCAELLKRHGIIHDWFHLPLDDADFGTSAFLANALGLQETQKANPEGIYMCSVIGKCEPSITGEYVLYSQLYAESVGINLLAGSHTNTEIFGVEQMVLRLVTNTDIKAIRIFEENY